MEGDERREVKTESTSVEIHNHNQQKPCIEKERKAKIEREQNKTDRRIERHKSLHAGRLENLAGASYYGRETKIARH